MPQIALFDDRKTDRDSLMRNFEIALPKDWTCIPSQPLAHPGEYREWILRNQVNAVVLDWVLNEQKSDVEAPVDYKGHVLVQAIRQHFPTMPLFVITAQPTDGDLKEHFGEIEAAFTRKDFSADPKKYTQTIVRASERFSKQFEDDLAELSDLSRRSALGSATESEIARMKAIQTSLGMATDDSDVISRSDALKKLESALDKLEQLGTTLEQQLREKKP